jgi:hypothetical protein
MEDVLEVYKRPFDRTYPTVNMDEQPVQLVKETRAILAARSGTPQRIDYEYERNGTARRF